MGKFEQNKHWRWEEVVTSHRSIEEYFEIFSIDAGFLKNKKILDIGAGTRRFADEVDKLDIGAEVYSVDPIYSLSKEELDEHPFESTESIEYIKNFSNTEVRGRTVAALGERLPFKDKVFDLILCNHCLPLYANNEEQIDIFFDDMVRALRDAGEIRMYSIGLEHIKKRDVIAAIDNKISLLSKKFHIVKKNVRGHYHSLLILKKGNTSK